MSSATRMSSAWWRRIGRSAPSGAGWTWTARPCAGSATPASGVAGVGARQASERCAGTVQAVSQHPFHRVARPGRRQAPVPGDQRAWIPRQHPGRSQAPRCPAGRHRRTHPRGHSQPPQDHLLDHAAPRHPHPQSRRTTAGRPARLPGHHPRLRPRSHLRRPRPPPARRPPHAVDPPGRTGRPQTDAELRRLPPPRPRRRHRRPHPALELGRRRRPCQPDHSVESDLSSLWCFALPNVDDR